MLTKTRNDNNQTNILLIRKLFGFFALSCVASSAHSDNSKDTYSYLDCSLVLNEMVNKEKGVEYQSSYRIDYTKNEIFIYEDRKNSYFNLCVSSECTLTDGLISWRKKEKDNSLEVAEYTGINRWTGKYTGWSTYRFDGKLSYDIRSSGECKSGVSKLRTKPKF